MCIRICISLSTMANYFKQPTSLCVGWPVANAYEPVVNAYADVANAHVPNAYTFVANTYVHVENTYTGCEYFPVYRSTYNVC